jgi:hypothetical protein
VNPLAMRDLFARRPSRHGDHVHWCPNGHCWEHSGPSALTCPAPLAPEGDSGARLDGDVTACPVCPEGEAPIQGPHQHRCASCKGEWTHEGRCRGGRLAWCPWCVPEVVREVPGTARGPHQHFCPECAQSWPHDSPCTEPLRRFHAECAARRSPARGKPSPYGIGATRGLPARTARARRRRRRRFVRLATSPLVLVPVGLVLAAIVYRLSWSPSGGPGATATRPGAQWSAVAVAPAERTPPRPEPDARGRGPGSSASVGTVPKADVGGHDTPPSDAPATARRAEPPTDGLPGQSPPPGNPAAGRSASPVQTRPPGEAAEARGDQPRSAPLASPVPPPVAPIPPSRASVTARAITPAPSAPAETGPPPQPARESPAPRPPTPSVLGRAAAGRPVPRVTPAPAAPVETGTPPQPARESPAPRPPTPTLLGRAAGATPAQGVPAAALSGRPPEVPAEARTDAQPAILGAPPAGSPGGAASGLMLGTGGLGAP